MDELLSRAKDVCTGLERDEILDQILASAAAASMRDPEKVADYLFALCAEGIGDDADADAEGDEGDDVDGVVGYGQNVGG